MKKNSDHYGEILRGAVGSLLLRFSGAFAGFLLSLVLARRLGPEGLGVYSLAITTVTIGATIAVGGTGQAVIKLIASESSAKNWIKIRQIALAAFSMTLLLGLCLAAIVFALRNQIAIDLLAEPRLGPALAILALAVVLVSLRSLVAQCLIGLQSVKSGVFVDAVLPQATALIVFLCLQASVLGAAAAYITGSLLSALVGGWIWQRHIRGKGRDKRHYISLDTTKDLLTIGIPTLGVLIGLSFGQWIIIYVLGIESGSEAVGYYRVAFQIAILLGFLLTATDSIMAPKISALYRQGNLSELAQICQFSIFMMILPGFPAVCILLVFPSEILSVFGPEFAAETFSLQVLALGQLINLITGSVGTILIMTGNEKKSFLSSLLGAFAALTLSIVLIPHYGTLGAAAALALTMAIRNISATFLVWRFVGINIWTGRTNRFASGRVD